MKKRDITILFLPLTVLVKLMVSQVILLFILRPSRRNVIILRIVLNARLFNKRSYTFLTLENKF